MYMKSCITSTAEVTRTALESASKHAAVGSKDPSTLLLFEVLVSHLHSNYLLF